MKIYYAGRDMEYLKKYGMIFKGTMIINQRKKYDVLTKSIIEKAIAEAAAEAGLIREFEEMQPLIPKNI